MNSLLKKLGLIIPGVFLGLNCFNYAIAEDNKKDKYSFSGFKHYNFHLSGFTHPIQLGDMDGDGDLDIIIIDSKGVIILENKIPQKNKDYEEIKK